MNPLIMRFDRQKRKNLLLHRSAQRHRPRTELEEAVVIATATPQTIAILRESESRHEDEVSFARIKARLLSAGLKKVMLTAAQILRLIFDTVESELFILNTGKVATVLRESTNKRCEIEFSSHRRIETNIQCPRCRPENPPDHGKKIFRAFTDVRRGQLLEPRSHPCANLSFALAQCVPLLHLMNPPNRIIAENQPAELPGNDAQKAPASALCNLSPPCTNKRSRDLPPCPIRCLRCFPAAHPPPATDGR